jgi:hypothetical protein
VAADEEAAACCRCCAAGPADRGAGGGHAQGRRCGRGAAGGANDVGARRSGDARPWWRGRGGAGRDAQGEPARSATRVRRRSGRDLPLARGEAGRRAGGRHRRGSAAGRSGHRLRQAPGGQHGAAAPTGGVPQPGRPAARGREPEVLPREVDGRARSAAAPGRQPGRGREGGPGRRADFARARRGGDTPLPGAWGPLLPGRVDRHAGAAGGDSSEDEVQ